MEEKINLSPVDQKNIFDKYGMIEEMKKKIDLAADAKGVLRCGLLWDVSCSLTALYKGMKADDESNVKKIETLKAQIQAMKGGVEN